MVSLWFGPKWVEMVQNGSNWSKTVQHGVQNRPKSFNMFQYGPNNLRWSKMVQNGPKWFKWSKMIEYGPKWSKIVQNGSKS